LLLAALLGHCFWLHCWGIAFGCIAGALLGH